MSLPSTTQRRRLGVAVTLVAAAAFVLVFVGDRHGGEAKTPVLDPFFVELQERTFRFFWETANPENGLIPDRYPSPSYSSVAAVGFGLTTYPIGVERGYITRDQARQRTLTTLRFFRDARQGPEARGTIGYKGFFYHFLDMKTGERFETT